MPFPTWTLMLLLGIIVILIVFFKTNLLKSGAKFDDKTSAQDAYALFLEEWQKENEALLQALTDMQNDVISRVSALQERVALLEEKTTGEIEVVSATESDGATELNRAQSEGDSYEEDFRGRHADICEMAENGMSIADIARQTGRGNGEIQLILGLAARGQTHE